LPRQIDIDKVSDEEIQDIVITANLTPRGGYGYYVDHQLASGGFNVGMVRQRTEHTCAGSGAVRTAVYAVKRLALKRCAAHQRRPHFRQTRPISR
jgi:hypothetical protein